MNNHLPAIIINCNTYITEYKYKCRLQCCNLQRVLNISKIKYIERERRIRLKSVEHYVFVTLGYVRVIVNRDHFIHRGVILNKYGKIINNDD